MKSIIIYESRNGSTAEYATWLSEETGIPAVRFNRVKNLDSYDCIILGSCVCMYKPTLASWIVRKWSQMSRAKKVLFTVAGAPAGDSKRKLWVDQALGDLAAELPHFALDGRMVFAKMGWLDRSLLKIGIKMATRSNPETAAKMGKEYDKVDRNSLAPLRAWLKEAGA